MLKECTNARNIFDKNPDSAEQSYYQLNIVKHKINKEMRERGEILIALIFE